MVLSTDPPFLFIHIPKTAGSSIEDSLHSYTEFLYHELTHALSVQYRDWLEPIFFESLFKFAFVRNPWDLQVSCWRYYVRNKNIDMTFDEFINWKFNGNILQMQDRLPTNDPHVDLEWLRTCYYSNRTPQTYYLIDESGKFIVNFIGAFEKLNEDFDLISTHLKLKDSFLPMTNESYLNEKDRDYKQYYTDETKEIIANRFDLDIKMFGYEFENPHPKNTGYINELNESLTKRGFTLPSNFVFCFGTPPYGLSNVKAHYYHNDMTDEERRRLFDIDKLNRKTLLYKNNILSVQNKISELENEMLNQTDNSLIRNKNSKEILDLNQKILYYRLQIQIFQNQLSEIEQAK